MYPMRRVAPAQEAGGIRKTTGRRDEDIAADLAEKEDDPP
jgi:hypothetical protein